MHTLIKYLALLAVLFSLTVAVGCGGGDPVAELKEKYADQPEYAIILNDMGEEGNFFKSYYHQYRVDIGEQKVMEPAVDVEEEYFQKYEPFLGMVVAAKTKDGKQINSPFPNGYQYVGNSNYGRWRTDSGGSFWEFYGQYALLSNLMGWNGYGLRRGQYDDWTTYRSSNRPYYGPNKEFGTNGTFTKKQYPNFYAKRAARKTAAQSRFQDKIKRRAGRSKNTFRSRGMSFGK